MVFELQLCARARRKTLRSIACVGLTAFALLSVSGSQSSLAAEALNSGQDYLKEAKSLYAEGQYFKTARYAFTAAQKDPSLRPIAYAWVFNGLKMAGLTQTSAYFFIRTLQSGNPEAIKSVLNHTESLILQVGVDLFRKPLIQFTRYEYYNSENRGAYLYALSKDALLVGDSKRAISYVDGISHESPFWAYGLQVRGTAHAILGRNEEAIYDFKECAKKSDRVKGLQGGSELDRESLKARCQAGVARTQYQAEDFRSADRSYDAILKKTLVWPDVLIEQAWNSFSKSEYNRTLGKLVTYKSPGLEFLFNTEIEVLRAQSFLALCLYSDANEVINQFNSRYTQVGVQIKEFVERNASQPAAFYNLGVQVLSEPLHTKDPFHRAVNRFIRAPYFQNLTRAYQRIGDEEILLRRFDSTQPGVSHSLDKGFPGFIEQVLKWRRKSIVQLGGAFVKNSLIDYHAVLIDDFEKMAFIKLEMLKRAKDKLMSSKRSDGERSRGNVIPSRRDDQYRWTFNGEFWADELGDYVFALESECTS